MERLNMTLDAATSAALKEHARRHGKPRATVARELICEALARREAIARQRKLAHDYSGGRGDASDVLTDLETSQLGLLEDDEP
jgi:hypothetical protein